MDEIIRSPNYNKISIDDNDHLSACIKFFSPLHLNKEETTGSICYSSKFKMKDKKNTVFKVLGFGWFKIDYKDESFYIYIKKIGSPKGLAEDTKIHREIEIYLNKKKKIL